MTLLSHMRKVFTSVINNKLQLFSEILRYDNSLPSGVLKKKNSTTDHIYALHTLFDLVKNQRKNVLLFCRSQRVCLILYGERGFFTNSNYLM